MREYAKLAPPFWIGATGKQLRGDPDAQVMALYLISSPHSNMLGLYYLPMTYLCHETGLTAEGASKALRRCIEVGFCDYDPETEMVWVIEAARFQIAERLSPNDKQTKGIANELSKLPKARLAAAFAEKYREAFHLPEALLLSLKPLQKAKGHQSPIEAPSKPLRSQEQEQEQEQEQNPSCAVAPHGRVGKDEPGGFVECWSAYPRRGGGNSRAEALKAYRARIKAGVLPADLLAGVQRYAAFVRATGKEGSAFVKQAATFLGPGEHWREAWELPAGSAPSPADGDWRANPIFAGAI